MAGDHVAVQAVPNSSDSQRPLAALQQLRDDPAIEDTYPLSPMQRGMLYHCASAPGAREYLEQVSLTLQGTLNVPALERAWQQVIDRNPVLRTAFVWEGLDQPFQVVRRQVRVSLEQQDWREVPAAKQKDLLAAYIQAEQQGGFDLSRPPLMRLALFRLAEDAYQLVWSNHHLLFDGWSKPLIINEVRAYYEAFSQNQDSQLECTRPYRDYIAWLQDQDLTKAEAFWRRALEGFSLPTALGGNELAKEDRPESAEGYEYQEISLSGRTTAPLQALGRQHQLTLNTLAQGAWALLLSRYSGEPDVVFGGVVSGRQADLDGIESMVGLFINTLPIRVRLSPENTLVPWLHEIQAGQIEARQYEHSPLVQVQRWSDVSRGSRLFESIVVFGNRPEDSDPSWALTEWSLQRSGYPLHIEINPGPELGLRITYSSSRFSRAAIVRMLGHLRTLLEAMVANPQQCLAELPLLTEAEKQRMLVEWNDTKAEYPLHQSFSQLFEAQVERTPDAVAAVFRGEQLTYREANLRANRLGHFLVQQEVGPEVTVALLTERNLEWLTAVLAVFKAGGAYLPLDPHHPAARLSQVLKQSGSPVVLTTRNFLPVLSQALETWPREERPRLYLIEDMLRREREEHNLPPRCKPADLAYVIYTSGSTGMPKGAMVEHAGMLNHLYAKITDVKLGSADVVTQTASQCFDISVWQLLAALLVGAEVHILEDEVVRDPARLLDQVELAKVSILELVPSLLRAVIAEVEHRSPASPRLEALRWMILTGEALAPGLCRQWLSRYPNIPLLNAYGPTECSDDVSHCAIYQRPAAEVRRMSIGRPIANTRLYILDSELRPTPIGVAGELCVGGIGVGRGYLNDRDQTSRSFVADPFVEDPGARLYKTGDLARFREDGDIDLLGRLDHQVKVRGFRIELGEIETILARHPGVREAVVVAREDVPGDAHLVAYLVAGQHQAPSVTELRSFLEQKLPDYMVPSVLVWLDALPLTANGKVDRRALPAPEQTRPELDGDFIAPRTPEEKLLAGIWAEVLGVERVGIHDNFFELGGNSLSATRVIARLPEELQSRLPLRRIFEAPTIARLAEGMSQNSVKTAESSGIQPIARGERNIQQFLTEFQKLSDAEVLTLLENNKQEQSSSQYVGGRS